MYMSAGTAEFSSTGTRLEERTSIMLYKYLMNLYVHGCKAVTVINVFILILFYFRTEKSSLGDESI